MTKAEFISKVQEATQFSKRDTEKAVSAFFDTIKEALEKGDRIGITGFGTFMVRERSERNGRNPKTGESIVIPATKIPAFKASKVFKESVNK